MVAHQCYPTLLYNCRSALFSSLRLQLFNPADQILKYFGNGYQPDGKNVDHFGIEDECLGDRTGPPPPTISSTLFWEASAAALNSVTSFSSRARFPGLVEKRGHSAEP